MDTSIGTHTVRAELRVGTRVDVHTRYELGRWAPGFTVAEVRPDGYRIRRASDGAVLKETMHPDEIRAASPVPSRRTGSQHPEGPPSYGRRRSSRDPRLESTNDDHGAPLHTALVHLWRPAQGTPQGSVGRSSSICGRSRLGVMSQHLDLRSSKPAIPAHSERCRNRKPIGGDRVATLLAGTAGSWG